MAVLEDVPTDVLSAARDPARLAALDGYGIVDSQGEPDFDDIVLLASRICATPVALVSLVAGDRQWFRVAVVRRQALRPEVFDAGRSVRSIGEMVGTLTGARIAVSIHVGTMRAM